MSVRQWSRGDRVVHVECPEWGVGEVLTAEAGVNATADGQRLTVRFTKAGMKTLTTSYAKLAPAGAPSRLDVAIEERGGWLDGGKVKEAVGEVLGSLPEEATDPFRPLKARIEATARLCRYSSSGGSLIEWASAQTGLDDPLSRFSRHELEAHFARFRQSLEAHLKRLVLDAKRGDPKALEGLSEDADRVVRETMRRGENGRSR